MVKRDIQIKDEQSSRYFVIDNDILSLSALKAYYPEISGLTYMKNDKLFCVLLEGDNFHFVPDIDTYKVYSKKGQVDTPATLSQFQKEKFQSVMNCIYNQQSELPKDNEKRKKISEKKTPQSPAQNNLVQIQIIWHHRDVDKKNFYKMPGSNKYIEVYKSVNYSVAHITSLCIEAHKNEVNSNYFEKGLVKIGRKNFEQRQLKKTHLYPAISFRHANHYSRLH
uniref:Uncharacterized protein n=1 Tax=Trichogramma kaykai TaxID=54128 RepID=A0ABD2XQ65_9HYME